MPAADILIVDDIPGWHGSACRQLAADDDHIHVLHRTSKEDWALTWRPDGLERGYDALVEHDAGGSHQPEELPRLLDALVSGADMGEGFAVGEGRQRRESAQVARSSPAVAASTPG